MKRRNFLRAALPRALAAVLVMSATTACAVVTSLVMTPVTPDPPTLGTMVSFAPDNLNAVKSVQWIVSSSYAGNCTRTLNYTLDQLNFTAQMPGSHAVSMYVKYQDPGMGQPIPPDTNLNKAFTISAADSVADYYGLNVLLANFSDIDVEFEVKAGGKVCGPELTGLAQERLTNIVRMNQPLPDQDWWPDTPTAFKLQGGVIYDNQMEAIDPPVWSALANGTFLSAKQEFRILYNTPCGGAPIEMPLGSRTTKHTKTSATEWCVE